MGGLSSATALGDVPVTGDTQGTCRTRSTCSTCRACSPVPLQHLSVYRYLYRFLLPHSAVHTYLARPQLAHGCCHRALSAPTSPVPTARTAPLGCLPSPNLLFIYYFFFFFFLGFPTCLSESPVSPQGVLSSPRRAGRHLPREPSARCLSLACAIIGLNFSSLGFVTVPAKR